MLIELRGVRAAYNGEAVLRGIDLTLGAGEIIGVMGPPDAGKTTLLKVLAGLVPATGVTMVRGQPEDLHCDLWRAQVGFAFQNDALFDGLSVYENVAFPLRRRRWPDDQVRARVDLRLQEMDLTAAAQRLPKDLSGGMRKRVGIARAIAIDAAVGLFDDPIAGLDPQTARRILAVLTRLNRAMGLTTCIVANDLPQLLPVCDRVVMLCSGEILFDDIPARLPASPRPEVRQFYRGDIRGPL